MTDPLEPLLDLPGVAESAAEARDAVDRLLGHQALRRTSAPVSAESVLRGARASAALEGSDYPLDDVRAGTITDPVLQGALRVGGGLGALAGTWERAPLQVVARLHLLAGFSADVSELGRSELGGSELGGSELGVSELGRSEEVWRSEFGRSELGRPVPGFSGGPRLAALAELVAGGTRAPAVIVAAVVHGELLTLAPFGSADGLVARAAARLTLISRGLDRKAVSVPEVGHLARQPEYVGAANAYATGTPDGVRAWLRHCCAAVTLGAEEGLAICGQLV